MQVPCARDFGRHHAVEALGGQSEHDAIVQHAGAMEHAAQRRRFPIDPPEYFLDLLAPGADLAGVAHVLPQIIEALG